MDNPQKSTLILRHPPAIWACLIPVGRTTAFLRSIIELSRVKPVYKIGKSTANDVVIAHEAISSTHCILRQVISRDGSRSVCLEDCSHYGTYLNGKKLSTDRPSTLRDNDLVSLVFETKSPITLKFRTSIDHLELSYELDSIIGRGAFSVVHRALEKDSGNKVAIKVIHRDELSVSGEGELDMKQEVEIMKGIDHPNIVDLRAVFDVNMSTYLVLELLPLGSLGKMIKQKTALRESDAKLVTMDVCRALCYLHSRNIVHRDVKPANILVVVQEPIYVKLADFGLAKVFGPDARLQTLCGTLSYMAPELFSQRRGLYTPKVDSWGLGVTVFQMLSNSLPWKGQEHQWKDGKPVPKPIVWKRLRHGVSQKAQNFISELLEISPTCRPEPLEAFGHPWIADEDL